MGEIYDQFELELASLGRKYAQHPRRQMIRLFLLALEREEIVSVGCREEVLAARLNAMPISEQEREIVRHALLWIWKEEEMHAINAEVVPSDFLSDQTLWTTHAR